MILDDQDEGQHIVLWESCTASHQDFLQLFDSIKTSLNQVETLRMVTDRVRNDRLTIDKERFTYLLSLTTPDHSRSVRKSVYNLIIELTSVDSDNWSDILPSNIIDTLFSQLFRREVVAVINNVITLCPSLLTRLIELGVLEATKSLLVLGFEQHHFAGALEMVELLTEHKIDGVVSLIQLIIQLIGNVSEPSGNWISAIETLGAIVRQHKEYIDICLQDQDFYLLFTKCASKNAKLAAMRLLYNVCKNDEATAVFLIEKPSLLTFVEGCLFADYSRLSKCAFRFLSILSQYDSGRQLLVSTGIMQKAIERLDQYPVLVGNKVVKIIAQMMMSELPEICNYMYSLQGIQIMASRLTTADPKLLELMKRAFVNNKQYIASENDVMEVLIESECEFLFDLLQ